MGNISSQNKKPEFYEVIDFIATKYILTLDFQSLSKLSENTEYCNDLILVTSDIIDKHFTELEVKYIAQRMRDGVSVDEMTSQKLMFLNKHELDNLAIQSDTTRKTTKQMLCRGVAKFYVKLAHVFACIMKTINPVYTYKNEHGVMIEKTLLEKDTIPPGASPTITKMNICENRIRALQPNLSNGSTASLHPKICDMNVNANGDLKTLMDEPGIPELMELYKDDYDVVTGKFVGMTELSKKQYAADLKLFYEAFTGETMPAKITEFNQIKLRDYQHLQGCQGENAPYKSSIDIPVTDNLYVQYAENIKQMIHVATENQNQLLYVLHKLFAFSEDDVRVHPKLTETKLQDCVEETRRLILILYTQCEQDYVNGIKLYEAIVQKRLFELTTRQIETLNMLIENPDVDGNESKKLSNSNDSSNLPQTSILRKSSDQNSSVQGSLVHGSLDQGSLDQGSSVQNALLLQNSSDQGSSDQGSSVQNSFEGLSSQDEQWKKGETFSKLPSV